jgi:L-idonate 5-dehydrogenase
MFEASGNELALRTGIEVLAPRATLVQIGLGGDVSIPQNTVVAKELELRGAFRFHEEFGAAVELIGSGALDLDRLLTARMPFSEATAAFELAGNRSKAMKVQLDFTA